MNHCPSPEHLEQALAGQLDTEEAELLETHVEGCPRCQRALEELTAQASAGPARRASPADGAHRETAVPGELFAELDPVFRQRLEQQPAPGDGKFRDEANSFSTMRRPDGTEANQPARPPEIAGYEVLEELGRGGMGVVYKAWHFQLKRLVALKVVRSGARASPEIRARFRNEVEAVARLQHPHIVQIYEVGERDGLPYCTLEFVEGGSLARKLAGAPLPVRAAAQLAAHLARAIHAAHQLGIIHRDLTPGNVLLTADGTAKITDFGLAKLLIGGSDQTESGVILGTPSYLAPEQAQGKSQAMGPATDVYALGAILYETLTGRPPFRSATALETVFQVVSYAPVPPSRLQPSLPRDLETICLKCLEKDPRKRYASALLLAEDLESWLVGHPIRARRSGIAERAFKWARRHPAVAGLLALVVLVTATGFGGVLWQWRQAEEARQQAAATAEAESAMRQQAVVEKQIAEAVRMFLQHDLLQQANATVQANAARRLGGGVEALENPTIKELLDRAAAGLTPDRIEARFPGQKEVQASILATVGDTYRSIGEYGKAVEFLTRARDIYLNAFEADYLPTLETLHNLAVAYLDLGKLPQAVALFERVRDAQVKKLGADHPDTLFTQNSLAVAYQDVGKLLQAIALFEQVRDAQRKQLGADHWHTLATSHNLARAYQAAGKLPQAIELYEQVRDAQLKQLGADHPDNLTTMNNLAGAYQAARKLPQAIELYQQVLAAREKKLGAVHPLTVVSVNNLAAAYYVAGKREQAMPLFRQAAEAMEKRKFQHADAGKIVGNLIFLYEVSYQFAEAEPWRRKWLAVVKERDGADTPASAWELALLGWNLLNQKKWTEADGVLHECLILSEKLSAGPPVGTPVANAPGSSGVLPWQVANVKSLLGEALTGQQKYADAEPLLLAGATDLLKEDKTFPPGAQSARAAAIQRLIVLYEATDQKENAVKWRQRLEEANGGTKNGPRL